MFKRMATGLQGALEEILGVYGNDLRKTIMRIVHNKAWTDEILFDTMLALWEDREKVAALENPAGWLFTTARYKSIDKIREEKNYSTELSLNHLASLEDAASIEDDLNRKELYKTVQAAIDKLPPREKTVYFLFTKQGWTRKQIARKFRLSESTIKNHLTLARKAIRKYVADNMRSLFV